MRKPLIQISFFLFLSLTAFSQSTHKYLRQGDKNYEKSNYQNAEDAYRKAYLKQNNSQSSFNLGNSIYQQNRFDEAAQKFEESAQKTKDKNLKAKAYHNLGNAYFEKREFEKSLQAYREALKYAPGDKASQHNLALATFLNQQQHQQQQQQQQQQQNQEPQQQKSTQNTGESNTEEK